MMPLAICQAIAGFAIVSFGASGIDLALGMMLLAMGLINIRSR